MKTVTLYISNKQHAFAVFEAEKNFGLTPKEYLSDMLSEALIERIELSEVQPILPFEILMPPEENQISTDTDWRDELEEDEGGGIRTKSDNQSGGVCPRCKNRDMDDDIPF